VKTSNSEGVDFLLVAKDDELDRKLQGIGLVTKKGTPKRM